MDHERHIQWGPIDGEIRRLGSRLRRLAVVGLVALAFCGGMGVDRIGHGGGADAGSTLSEADGYETLQQTWDLIQNEYVDLDSVSEQELLQGAASGMTDALGDTGHSTFLTPAEAEAFTASTEGQFVGIGIQLDFQTGQAVIAEPMDDSPAAEAGLRADDVIEAIDGESIVGLDPALVAERLGGEEGEAVTLSILRPAGQERFDVTVVRSLITLHPVRWRMLPGGIAQIRLSEFSIGATDELRAALAEARADGVVGVILDLRGNPGGLVDEAIGVSSEFLPAGAPVYQVKDRDGTVEVVQARPGGTATELPVVVVINRGSASSAEITAAALHDNGRARLVGQTTYGTGTQLTPYPLNDGSVLLLGTELWLEADGEQPWRKGIEPDIDVQLTSGADVSRPSDDDHVTLAELTRSKDSQLQVAYEALAGDVLADE